MVVSIFLDQITSILDSLRDLVGSIKLLDRQLIFNVLHGVILHLLYLGKLELNSWVHLRHHVVEWLLHVHELVVAHHAWRERLRLSILVVLLLGSGVGGKHHLHVDIGVHVHALARESHLTGHHHTSWEGIVF